MYTELYTCVFHVYTHNSSISIYYTIMIATPLLQYAFPLATYREGDMLYF